VDVRAEVVTSTRVPRLDSLTGLRFFAAFLVFGYHAQQYGSGFGWGVFDAGMTGVSFFYIVSGFVLAWSAQPGTAAGTFWGRRFARIYPAYVAAWVVSLALAAVVGSGVAATDLWAPTLLQAWVPDRGVYFSGNAVFWSLSCEAFFYAVFPWLIRVVAPLTTRALARVAGACVVTTAALAALADAFLDTTPPVWAITIFPPARLPEFLLGMALALLVARGSLRPSWLRPLPMGLLAIAAIVAAGHAPVAFSRAAVTVVPFALLVCATAVSDVTGRRSLLRHRVLVDLGVWSYCFYLIHTQVLTVWSTALEKAGAAPAGLDPGLFIAACSVALGAAVAAAWLLHVLVEHPAERRLRPRGRARAD
jgi:peptidoglycan/LPS O-acetylase OafA/YrhL